jgi:hypothetical protein
VTRAPAPGESAPALAAHRIRLGTGPWALWRSILLRSAGFPADGATVFADPASAEAADRWNALKRRRADRSAVRAAGADLERSIAAGHTAAATAARRILSDGHFREAITWQNSALLPFLDRLAERAPEAWRSNDRRRLLKLAAYWQRYCVKNETIGSFGPVAWATLTEAGPAAEVRPGPDLLARRTVYFEGWAVDTLADALSADGALLQWVAPRQVASVSLEGATAYRPYAPPVVLSRTDARVLELCDGIRTATEVRAEALREGIEGIASAADVRRTLERLVARGLLSWKLDVPLSTRPEAALERSLWRVEDHGQRERGLSALRELVSARDAVARAAGRAEALGPALADLDATFTRLTGAQPLRSPGATYAARTLVYEDCVRDLDVRFGGALLAAIAEPLGLLLQSARWYTHRVAEAFRGSFEDVYGSLARKAGSPVVELAQMPFLALMDKEAGPIEDPRLDLASRWEEILRLPPDARRVAYPADLLRPAVQRAFDAPAPGWTLARYHSPDVMIASTSADAIERGEYELVLGELHLAVNSILLAAMVEQHPQREALLAAVERDLPGPCVIGVVGKHWPRVTSRLFPMYVSPRDLYLSVGPNSGGFPASRGLPLSALVVERAADGLVARTRDGKLRFDLIELFGMRFTDMLLNRFRMWHEVGHRPRVTIDRLVVSRESWSSLPAELGFAFEDDDLDRFAAARAWAADRGIPRFVFARSPIEVKPVFADIDSPVYVDLLARLVRRSHEARPDRPVTLTEMLPSPADVWLPDAAGRRYTCELRMIAVDLAGLRA